LNADGTPNEHATDHVERWIEDEVTDEEVEEIANAPAVAVAPMDLRHHPTVMQHQETFPDVDPQNSQILSGYHAKQVAVHLQIPLKLVHALVEIAEQQGNEFSHLSQCDRGWKLQTWWVQVQNAFPAATEKELVEASDTVLGVIPELDFKFSKGEVVALYLTSKGRMPVVIKNMHKILQKFIGVQQFYKDFLENEEGIEYCPATMERVAEELYETYPLDYDLFDSVHGPLTVMPAVHALILLCSEEGLDDPYILGSLQLHIVYACVKLWLTTTKKAELFSKAKALLGSITAKTAQKSAKGKGKGKRVREDADVGKPGSSLGFGYDVVREGALRKEAALQDKRRKKSQFDEDLSLSTRMSLNAQDEVEGRGKQSQDKPFGYRTPSPEVPAEQEELEGTSDPRRRRGGGGSEGGGGGGAGRRAGARGSRDEGGSRGGGSRAGGSA
jgi:hypothetical protein